MRNGLTIVLVHLLKPHFFQWSFALTEKWKEWIERNTFLTENEHICRIPLIFAARFSWKHVVKHFPSLRRMRPHPPSWRTSCECPRLNLSFQADVSVCSHWPQNVLIKKLIKIFIYLFIFIKDNVTRNRAPSLAVIDGKLFIGCQTR